jgi:arsenate reductase
MTKTNVLTVYTYSNCDTCRRAVKWLRSHAIVFDEKPIRETPPTPAELRLMLKLLGGAGALRKLFNTSGVDYRTLKLGEKLPSMTEVEAITLLAGNGNLVKRPFALGMGEKKEVGLVGFDETAWTEALAVT